MLAAGAMKPSGESRLEKLLGLLESASERRGYFRGGQREGWEGRLACPRAHLAERLSAQRRGALFLMVCALPWCLQTEPK